MYNAIPLQCAALCVQYINAVCHSKNETENI